MSEAADLVTRPMTTADIPAVRELWTASDGLGFGPGDAPAELTAFLARNPDLSPVALIDGAIVGALLAGGRMRHDLDMLSIDVS